MNICHNCRNQCETSWMIMKNDGIIKDTEKVKAPEMIHHCSYLCYSADRGNLPKKLWHLVQNKEDFSEPRPVTLSQKKKEFQYLSFEEIQRLSEDQKETYYQDKDYHMLMNPDVGEIYNELEKEDERTYYLEEEEDNYSDNPDDY